MWCEIFSKREVVGKMRPGGGGGGGGGEGGVIFDVLSKKAI